MKKFETIPFATKPLVVGWTPSRKKFDLMGEGRGNELPGYWLYNLQFKLSGKAGKIAGWLFGAIYAARKVK